MEEQSSYGLIAGSVAGLVIGAALFGAVLLWPSAPTASDAASPRAVAQPPIEATPTLPVTISEPTKEPAPAAIEEPVPAPTEPDVVEAKNASEAKPQAEVAPVAEKRVAERIDPLELDPEGLDLGTLEREPVPSIDRAITEPPPSPELAASTQPVVRRGHEPQENLAARDARQRFGRRLPAFSVKGMTLVDFLSLMSQLGGVPVSVGSEQLLMAGISPREQVSLDVQDKSLDVVLAEALDPLRLTHEFRGAQVVVVRQGADRVREIEYPIDDLKSSPQQLAAWVRQLIAPESWQAGKLEVAEDSLRIEHSQDVHYQVLVFLERLRLAGGLLPRSRYPIQRLAPTPLHKAMAERLSAPALFTFSRETPLAEVLLHWQRELDVPLLVDWPALAEVDLWPESTIVCAVADKSWEAALDEVLQPLGLDWRATFGGAIEISSAERLRHDLQLELYPLRGDKSFDPQELVVALRKTLSTAAGELAFDPAANALFALQPASAQRQILSWLSERALLHVP
jgi:hypothetical protein